MPFRLRSVLWVHFVALSIALASERGLTQSSTGAQGRQLEKRVEALEKAHREQLDTMRRDYERRLDNLERRSDGRDASTGPAVQGGAVQSGGGTGSQGPAWGGQIGGQLRRGIGRLGQTTIFDNTFNPALSLSADFALPASDKSDSFEDLNQFQLRSMEVGIVGRVDPLMSYQTYIHFDEEEVEIEEAFGLVDNWLPDTFMLKWGRFNLDFGKLSPIHDHDLTFLDKPQVLQEYLGGSLRGTGVELHQWFPVGDSNLMRWMVGVTNGLDGDSHATFGPGASHEHEHDEEEGAEPFGRRQLKDFSFHGRVSGLLELDDDTTLQLGVSAAWSPRERTFFEQGSDVRRRDLERLVGGADITYTAVDQAAGSQTRIAGELLFSDREFLDEGTGDVSAVDAYGFFAYAERSFNVNWTAGISGGHFEHAEDASLDSWDAGGYATWNVNEFNRIRFEVRHFDDPDEDYFGATLQWTIILGSHGHGIDW